MDSEDVFIKTMRCREFAVHCLAGMPDHDVASYMLEFAQLMKKETLLTESPLAAFLMYRALRNPYLVGQALYWNIRSEMHDEDLFPRFSLFLRQYLDRCGRHREELRHQEQLMVELRDIIKHIKGERERRKAAAEDYSIHALREVLKADLGNLSFPDGGLRLPVKSNMHVTGIVVEKCKVLGSHQVPLWLVFTNADPTAEDVNVILKDGDDVRQDTLVLQFFNIMQEIWEER